MTQCGIGGCAGAGGLTRRRLLTLAGTAAVAPALSGCDRLAPLLVSDATVEALGLRTWERMVARMPTSRDRAARARLERITGRLLLAAGQSPAGWQVRVFADPAVNAFVLPGRRIGVFAGMMRVAGTDGELAAVIGHEVGHLMADHPRERMGAEILRQEALRLISFLLAVNEVAFAREIAALVGVGAEFGLVRPYGRRQELEADRLGLFMMAEAGFDPEAAARLWQRMDARGGAGVPAFLSTHSAPRARIEAIRELIPEAKAAAGRGA